MLPCLTPKDFNLLWTKCNGFLINEFKYSQPMMSRCPCHSSTITPSASRNLEPILSSSIKTEPLPVSPVPIVKQHISLCSTLKIQPHVLLNGEWMTQTLLSSTHGGDAEVSNKWHRKRFAEFSSFL